MSPLTYLNAETPAQLIQEHRGYYLIVNAISKRVRQLQLGERAQALPPDGSREAVRIATQEFLEDKLEITQKQVAHRMVDMINREDE